MRSLHRVIVMLMAVVLAACGGATSLSAVDSADPNLATPDAPEETELNAILEHVNTHVTDLGDGWVKVDEWYTEGAETEWTTGCAAFDRLGDMFNAGTPQTTVWERGAERAVNRTDDFNWGAYEFAFDVERIPDSCSEVTADSIDIEVTAVDETMFVAANERMSEGDPNGVIVAIRLDAYPIPNLETDISLPEFEADTPTWIVVATQHNVVSLLIYAPGAGDGVAEIVALVDAQVSVLVGAGPEVTGSFESPSPPPSVAPSTARGVELVLSEECRNEGSVDAGGVRWALAESAPSAWEGRSPIVGDIDMDGTGATFTSHANDEIPETFSVQLTTGFVDAFCGLWDGNEPSVVDSLTVVGPLDCGERPVVEERFTDAGHDPLEIATTYQPAAVRVESTQPLWWTAFDDNDLVVAAFAIGDTDNPDWQVWTCG